MINWPSLSLKSLREISYNAFFVVLERKSESEKSNPKKSNKSPKNFIFSRDYFPHSKTRYASLLTFNWEGVPLGGTNLGINGLVSADRNNKATLPLTTPRYTIKSSAKDLSLRIVKLKYTDKDSKLFRMLPPLSV